MNNRPIKRDHTGNKYLRFRVLSLFHDHRTKENQSIILTRLFIISISKIYNTALMINADCRTADALAYLLKEFKEIDREHKDDTDEWLEALFNGELIRMLVKLTKGYL